MKMMKKKKNNKLNKILKNQLKLWKKKHHKPTVPDLLQENIPLWKLLLKIYHLMPLKKILDNSLKTIVKIVIV